MTLLQERQRRTLLREMEKGIITCKELRTALASGALTADDDDDESGNSYRRF